MMTVTLNFISEYQKKLIPVPKKIPETCCKKLSKKLLRIKKAKLQFTNLVNKTDKILLIFYLTKPKLTKKHYQFG